MSEARDADTGEDHDAGIESETETVETEDQQDAGDEGEEGEEKPQPKPVDWEKRAHSHAGQAARERSRRQAAERRATELNDRLETLERRSGGGQNGDELLELIGHLRDDDEDPVGDIAAVKRALKLYRQREVGSLEESRLQERANREVSTLKNAMADAETDFTDDHPDYRDAAAYYRKARTEELTDMGYSGDELMHKLSGDLFGLVRTAFATGLDPAERVYNLAVKRGFKAGAASANKKLDALDRASQSGVRPQARASAGVLSWSDVAKLDGAARDKAWAKLREREKARK